MKFRNVLMLAATVSASLSVQSLAGIPSPSRPLSLVAFMGQIAPDTGGARFASLSQGVLNNIGQIGFVAGLVGGGAARGAFVYSQGQVSAIALQGQPVPGSSGSAFVDFSEPAINDSGVAVFTAVLSGGTIGGEAVYLRSGKDLARVVDGETEVPGAPGQKFSIFRSPAINNSGDIAFEADLDSSGPLSNGIWMVSGGVLKKVALGNDMIPGTSQTFGSIDSSFSLNNLGDVAFANHPGAGSNGIFLYSKGSIAPVSVGSQAVPDSTLVLAMKLYPRVNDRQEVVFVNAFVSGRSYSPNALVLWQAGRLQKIAMSGDAVPQFGNAPIGNDLGDVSINNRGVISLRARINVSDHETPEAIFTVDNGKWNFIVSEGNTLTDVGRFDFLGFVHMNDQGALTFVSNMTDGSFGIYAVGSLPYRFFLPQVADGASSAGSWRTTNILANRSSSQASATVSYWKDDGSPLSLSIQGQSSSQFTYTIPPLGSLRIKTDGSGNLKTGWALVQADQSLSGIAIYSFFDTGGNFVNEAGAPFSLDFSSMSIFADLGADIYTGIALANPNSVATTVTLTLRDQQSSVIGTTQFDLPANGHLAKYISEIFAFPYRPNLQGTLEIVGTQTLAGLTLRQRNSSFTSLPVIP